MASLVQLVKAPLSRGAVGFFSFQALRGGRNLKAPISRTYANASSQGKSRPNYALMGAVAAAGLGGAYYWYSRGEGGQGSSDCATGLDYKKVYKAIAEILNEDEDYDQGSYGPIFLRLAWHSSGTYDKSSKSGGSNGGTMRFDPEASFDANKGLHIAREKLEKVKEMFPSISYGDLWTLAGVVAVQEMGGPKIPWRPGRVDGVAKDCPPDGRLPDGGNPSPQHPRDIFYRMGFNDQEIVALVGAHGVGECHADRSGFLGPWTFSPTTFSNSYYTVMLNNTWVPKNWKGPKQFEDKRTGILMMLPADLAFNQDKDFKKYVEMYAKDEDLFFKDFARAFKKLIELGVDFPDDTKDIIF